MRKCLSHIIKGEAIYKCAYTTQYVDSGVRLIPSSFFAIHHLFICLFGGTLPNFSKPLKPTWKEGGRKEKHFKRKEMP